LTFPGRNPESYVLHRRKIREAKFQTPCLTLGPCGFIFLFKEMFAFYPVFPSVEIFSKIPSLAYFQ
jgi:hypothetical protein